MARSQAARKAKKATKKAKGATKAKAAAKGQDRAKGKAREKAKAVTKRKAATNARANGDVVKEALGEQNAADQTRRLLRNSKGRLSSQHFAHLSSTKITHPLQPDWAALLAAHCLPGLIHLANLQANGV